MARQLVRFSFQELQGELRRRQRTVGSLESKRSKLLKKLQAVENQILQMGGMAGGGTARGVRSGSRPKNDMTLTDALAKVLSNKTMSVVDASDAVQKIGYRTSSNNFRTQVNIALIKSGKFKRVGRGQYTVK